MTPMRRRHPAEQPSTPAPAHAKNGRPSTSPPARRPRDGGHPHVPCRTSEAGRSRLPMPPVACLNPGMRPALPRPDYQQLFSAAPAPFLLLTPDLLVVDANRAYLE